ncbi:uncharacterized protein BYT42DRAFT_612758 [Radiomyces spectabilis]|uniref:uncharacterized protein n=1 Tax=Radiomyces spectabilis TaxID=64574 RepID=UPI00221EEA50|nr:uncharacterized protein BYT42DRAFT_612758 [Radiomyces spectabilis]KAI8380925.1 hypothetical protein BYT42DRAFT_612758 [Radiomyces spectabilis]
MNQENNITPEGSASKIFQSFASSTTVGYTMPTPFVQTVNTAASWFRPSSINAVTWIKAFHKSTEDHDREALTIEGGQYVRLNSVATDEHSIEPLIHYHIHNFYQEEDSDPAPALPEALSHDNLSDTTQEKAHAVAPEESDSDGGSEAGTDNDMETDDEYERYCFDYRNILKTEHNDPLTLNRL